MSTRAGERARIEPVKHLQAFKDVLEPLRDAERAKAKAVYFRGHFEFYGVQAPERRVATKEETGRIKELSGDDPLRALRICKELWTCPEREMQYIGMDLLDACRKHWTKPEHASFVELEVFLEHVIGKKQWWDSIDKLAPHTVADVLEVYPAEMRETLDKWIVSDDVWIRRTAILCQLNSKKDTDAEMLFRFIRLRWDDDVFWINKAIGWALRAFRRTDPQAVDVFVEENLEHLCKLSVKEAWKHKKK